MQRRQSMAAGSAFAARLPSARARSRPRAAVGGPRVAPFQPTIDVATRRPVQRDTGRLRQQPDPRKGGTT